MTLTYSKILTDNYQNLRQVLKQEFCISANILLSLKRNKKILLNGETTFLDSPINVGDIISVNFDLEEDNSNVVPKEIPLNIIYEDEAILVINKPVKMPVHPSMQHFNDSLSNGVKYYFDKIGLHKKIRPVNRLDRNTTGIVVFAKNEYVHSILSKQMQNNIFKKEYIAVCEGRFEDKFGSIDKPIKREDNSIIKRCVATDGDVALTEYKVIDEVCLDKQKKEYCSILNINLKTGRTHQIRVHTAYIGHPILGDSLYGNSSDFISRQALHAHKIAFIHPINKKELSFIASIPEDINSLFLIK